MEKDLEEIIKIMNDDHHMGYQRTGEKRESGVAVRMLARKR